jgi:uncharacterized protein (TIGR00255 family)
MTGFGEARAQGEAFALAVDIRAVNNRHLKVTVRAPEPLHLLEAEFEKVIRRSVRRGSVLVHVRLERTARPGDFRVNAAALRSYAEQVLRVANELGLPPAASGAMFGSLLTLPGVTQETDAGSSADADWPLVEPVLEQAVANLQSMRRGEGAAMARELLSLCDEIAAEIEQVRQRAPVVTTAYRDRLLERVRQLLADTDVTVSQNDVLREVSVFAERSDVAEEVVRLASHLDQFREVATRGDESAGRKLEFLTQEMFREANTIGSKAGDVQVSRHVVAVKATLEKVRELIQNVE